MSVTGPLIDTHAHLYLDPFSDDLQSVLDDAERAGVVQIIMPAIDLDSIGKAIDLCEAHENLFAMAAIHPSETKTATDSDFEEMRSFVRHSSVIAIGETGLDYYWDKSFTDRQHYYLRKHIRLAIEEDLPLILHNREASDDLIKILSEEKAASESPGKLRGIFHCFSGPASLGKSILDLGFHVGIGGTLTFKNAGVPDAITDIPLSSIVLETDAPFLAPVPFRGKRNEPSYLRRVVEKLALVRNLDENTVAVETTRNARSLFGLS
jgi:TatD DNase family protein